MLSSLTLHLALFLLSPTVKGVAVSSKTEEGREGEGAEIWRRREERKRQRKFF